MTQGDRALDKRIAEEVFDYEVVTCTDTIHAASFDCPVWRFNAREEDGYLSSQPAVPAYSSDISAAMIVFEAAVERFGEGAIHLSRASARGQGHIYVVEIGVDIYVVGPLPQAICEAALAALSAAADGQGREV